MTIGTAAAVSTDRQPTGLSPTAIPDHRHGKVAVALWLRLVRRKLRPAAQTTTSRAGVRQRSNRARFGFRHTYGLLVERSRRLTATA